MISKTLKTRDELNACDNCQNNIDIISRKPINMLNSYFQRKDMYAFWNKLKSNNHSKTSSKLKAQELAEHYSGTMNDNRDLTSEQERICQNVKTKATSLSCICTNKGNFHYSKKLHIMWI